MTVHRPYDVDGYSPRVKIEHSVGKNEQIASGNIAALIAACLQACVSEQLGRIAAVIDDLIQRMMDERNMKAFEIIFAVQSPMCVDFDNHA